jgi:YesN/AraC family two-component response regulator
MGYTVKGVPNGVEALKVFSEDPTCFDIVITDLTMPGMTGEKLAGEIYRLNPDIPVVICSGYNTYFPDEKTRETGIRDILIKPVPMKDLAEAIRNIMDGIKDVS